MPTNPHDHLGGLTPRAKGIENERIVVDWVYRWQYSSAALIQARLGKQASGWAALAVKRKLLYSIENESGLPSKLFFLAPRGLELAQCHAAQLLDYDDNDSSRINMLLVRHNLLTQSLTLNALKKHQISDFVTENQLWVADRRLIKRPDAVWVLPSGVRLALEVELTAKWGRRLDEFVGAIVDALERDEASRPFDQVLIATYSKAICERYRLAFSLGAPLKEWSKDARGHWKVQQQGEVPAGIQKLINFRLIAAS